MGDYSEVFVAFDVAKLKNAVAIAEAGRAGQVRYLGEIENTTAAVRRSPRRPPTTARSSAREALSPRSSMRSTPRPANRSG